MLFTRKTERQIPCVCAGGCSIIAADVRCHCTLADSTVVDAVLCRRYGGHWLTLQGNILRLSRLLGDSGRRSIFGASMVVVCVFGTRLAVFPTCGTSVWQARRRLLAVVSSLQCTECSLVVFVPSLHCTWYSCFPPWSSSSQADFPGGHH